MSTAIAQTTSATTTISGEALARALLAQVVGEPDSLMYGLLRGVGTGMHALVLLLHSVYSPLPRWLLDAFVEQHDILSHRSINHETFRSTDCGEEVYQAILAGNADSLDALLDKALIIGCAQWGKSLHNTGLERWHQLVQEYRRRLAALPLDTYDDCIEQLTSAGKYWIIAPDHPCWPAQWNDLSQRTEAVAPLCVWGRGDVHSLVACSQPVAIVGSRYASPSGIQLTQQLALHAARLGHTVVSGGAMGIDAAAHASAVRAYTERQTGADESQAGRTLVISAGGLLYLGPVRNRQLFEQIVQAHGALISEMAPSEIPKPHRFLLRNRLIAALASTIIIVQAQARSGALNTATWAADLSRTVLAVPGDIQQGHHAGCHELVYQGKATLLPHVQALDDWLHEAHTPTLATAIAADAQQAILQCLGRRTMSVAMLLERLQSRYPSRDILSALGLLEARHEIERSPQGAVHAVTRSSASTRIAAAHHTLLIPN